MNKQWTIELISLSRTEYDDGTLGDATFLKVNYD